VTAAPHHDERLAPPRVVELAERVFAYVQPDGTWWINNAGFIAGSDSLLSIDTCSTERRTRDYLAAVSATTGRMPSVVVNTHHHGDHTNGNCLVEGATIVAHARCREEMARTGIGRYDGVFDPVEWGELTLALPTVTFERRLDLHVGDLHVELLHVADAAHTTNDVVAWVPEHRVLYSGDLVFNGGTPFVVMGSVAGSIRALDAIAELDPAVIVPGHGEPCDVEMIDACARYLRFVQDSAAAGIAAGLTPLEVAREADLGEFGELTDSERLAGNLHRAYAEAHGAAPGDPIDLVAAFTDMISLNGGAPLRCRA
jgi:cyclase